MFSFTWKFFASWCKSSTVLGCTVGTYDDMMLAKLYYLNFQKENNFYYSKWQYYILIILLLERFYKYI